MAKKQIHINESQLHKLVESALNELSPQTYMNAANKRHQQAMDYTGTNHQATGSEQRRLDKWNNQAQGTLMQGRNGASYGGGYTPQSANQEELSKSAYALRNHAQKQYKQQNQTDTTPNNFQQWGESFLRDIQKKVTENVIKRINESYEQTVTITMDDYITLLNARRQEIEPRGWTIPDIVWNYFIEMIEDCGISDNPQHNSPSYVVDNLAVNGDYGDFDNYKEEGESDEDFIAREQDNCVQIFPEERYIIYAL